MSTRRKGGEARSRESAGEVGRLVRLAAGTDGRATEAAAMAFLARHPGHPVASKALSAGLITQAKYEEAVAVLEPAIEAIPHDWELHHNLAIAFLALRRFGELAVRMEASVKAFPDNHEFWKTLGSCYAGQHRWTEAIAALLKAIELSPSDDYEAISEVGSCLFNAGRYEEALVCLKESLRGKHRNEHTLACILHARLRICDWAGLSVEIDRLRRVTRGFTKAAAGPFHLLSFPGLSAEEYVSMTSAFATAHHAFGAASDIAPRGAETRLRIGYLSADFREHPVGYLISEVLLNHDRSRFEIHGYGLHPADDSELSRRILASLDGFRDVSAMGDREVCDAIRSDRIDLLVDLTGWTTYGRSAVLGLRPAPVTINWLGFPGTLGQAQLADYIIADSVVIPEEHAHLYSEKVWRLPGCYLPYDGGRPAESSPARTTLGLPDTAFVFCSFNNSYKFNPGVFDVWCRILHAVPDSLLWLSDAGDRANQRLGEEALRRGVSLERIMFAPRLGSRGKHLARVAAADLALDPFPYNSHSTGMDALWAGVPMVSLLGSYFPGRAGASALTACGLTDLVARDPDDYVRIAVGLAMDPARLRAARVRLGDPAHRGALFDMKGYTRRLETAFVGMANAGRSGADGDH